MAARPHYFLAAAISASSARSSAVVPYSFPRHAIGRPSPADDAPKAALGSLPQASENAANPTRDGRPGRRLDQEQDDCHCSCPRQLTLALTEPQHRAVTTACCQPHSSRMEAAALSHAESGRLGNLRVTR